LACALTLAVYAGCARLGTAVFGNDDPSEAAYNRMIDGFLAGHVYLRREVPPAFAQLADPYDPAQNAPFREPPYYLYDLSYFRGRIYAYFGPAAAVLLFLPYHVLTGAYLSYKAAAMLLVSLSFLAVAVLACDARRRYAPAMPDWLLATALLAPGIASVLPSLLARVDVWEVPVAAVCAFIALSLLCLWRAWHASAARYRWLAGASLALGLAVGSRPTALALTALLGLFLVEERLGPGGRWNLRSLGAAALPLTACLAALAAFNYGRFGNLLDSGHSYQLAGDQYESRMRLFSLRYIWDNVRLYYLHPAPWVARFPFVGDASAIALSSGHAETELTFGLLLNVPLAWCALGALPAARRRDGLGFLVRAGLLAAAAEAGLFLLFFASNIRYEIEFLFPLIFLAVLGLIAGEGRPGGSRLWRILWIVLAIPSVAFALGHAAHRALGARQDSYGWAMSHGQPRAAIRQVDTLLWAEPGNADFHNDRGVALSVAGDLAAGQHEFEEAVRLDPGSSRAHCNVGFALLRAGNPSAAEAEFDTSLQLDPHNAGARTGLDLVRRATAGGAK
jgi:tetratricopeptide (TPR) repeat protein